MFYTDHKGGIIHEKNVKVCSLIIALILCISCATAEEYYWDSSMRTPDLYVDCVYTFNDYFKLTLPEDWQARDLPEEDVENGIIAVLADDLDNPGMKVTTSIFTPDECTEIFGGTGYDAVFEAVCANVDGAASVCINDVWTILYTVECDDETYAIADMTTSDGYMFQIRMDVYDRTEENSAIMNNIIWSLQYA